MGMRFSVVLEGMEHLVEVDEDLQVVVGDKTFRARVKVEGSSYKVFLGKRSFEFNVRGRKVTLQNQPLDVTFGGHDFGNSYEKPSASTVSGEVVVAPMPGRVVGIVVKEGDRIAKGSPLLILEAMKMQNEVPSPLDGIVREIRVSKDSVVGKDDALLTIG